MPFGAAGAFSPGTLGSAPTARVSAVHSALLSMPAFTRIAQRNFGSCRNGRFIRVSRVPEEPL